MVCLDGGAMHIAAAIRKSIVKIWGSTDPSRWRPWGVRHILLQNPGKKAEKVDVFDVYKAVEKLLMDRESKC